jgi:hypothetical protein
MVNELWLGMLRGFVHVWEGDGLVLAMQASTPETGGMMVWMREERLHHLMCRDQDLRVLGVGMRPDRV